MLVESTISLVSEKKTETVYRKKGRNVLDYLPMKLKFRHSKIYISVLLTTT